MKRILCYGDSNTWGATSGDYNKRYPGKIRFTKQLQILLGRKFKVIEEGFPGRTMCSDDFKDGFGNRNGSYFFGQCVCTHDPLDYVVIMLGTNDLKTEFNKTAEDCAIALKIQYIDVLNTKISEKLSKIPKIIVVAPAKIDAKCWGKFEFAEKKSEHFNEVYKKVALKNNCLFVSNDGLKGGVDDIHLTKESHALLAQKIANVINEYESKKGC